MLPFSERFFMAKGAPVFYNGKEVIRVIKYTQSVQISISILSTNAVRSQAIVLIPSPDFSGKAYVNGEKVPMNSPKRFPRATIWARDLNNNKLQIDLKINSGTVSLCNGAEQFIGDIPTCCYSELGCAMIQEIDPNNPDKCTVLCNDYENNDDFSDLVFEMHVCYT